MLTSDENRRPTPHGRIGWIDTLKAVAIFSVFLGQNELRRSRNNHLFLSHTALFLDLGIPFQCEKASELSQFPAAEIPNADGALFYLRLPVFRFLGFGRTQPDSSQRLFNARQFGIAMPRCLVIFFMTGTWLRKVCALQRFLSLNNGVK